MNYRRSLGLIYGITVLIIVGCSHCAADPLECYYCTDEGGPNTDDPLPVCAQLQNTTKFRKKCPNSTMCVRTIHSMVMIDGSIRTTEIRGCAKQFSKMYVLMKTPNGKWKTVEDLKINEVYEIGCTARKKDSMRSTTITDCYCRGNLCNSSSAATAVCDLNTLVKIIYIILVMRLIIA